MNPLTEIPPEIGSLVDLKSLFLKVSLIEVFPIELLSLKHLRHVYCHGSPLLSPKKNFIAIGKKRTKKIALESGKKWPFRVNFC